MLIPGHKVNLANFAVSLVVILHIALVAGCVSTSQKKILPSEVVEANVNLASEYFRLGRMEAALNSAKKAVAADSESVSANSLMALIYQRLEQSSLADDFFSNAVEFVAEDTGEYGIIHNNYAVFLCQNNRFLDADEHFLLAAKNRLYETPQNAYENAGVCALKGDRETLAEGHFLKSLELSPNMPRALFELANIQYNAEKYLSARAYIQRYHVVARGNAKSLYLAMMIEKKLGAVEQEQQIKNELKKRFPDSQETSQLKN